MSTEAIREVNGLITQWLWRVRVRDAVRGAVRGLAIALLLALALALAARFLPLVFTATQIQLSVVAAGAGLLIGAAYGFFKPRSRLAAARDFDRRLGLAERTSMALELEAAPERAPAWLVAQQWTDAAEAARRAPAAARLRLFDISRIELAVAAVCAVALFAGFAFWPNPQDTVLAQQQAVQQAIAEQIEKIEQAIAAIENNDDLTDDQKEALTEPLEQAQQALQQPGLTEDQAQEALAQAQQELRSLQDPNAQAQAQALQQAGEQLSGNNTTQSVGEALQNGDLQAAGEALQNIDPSTLSVEEQQALADQLEQAAESLSGTDPQTAQALQDAAEALRNGDTTGAQQALQQAGQSMQQAGQQAAQSQAAGQASDQVTDAQRAIAQAGQQGQQGQEGQGQGQGSGGGAGTGTGNGQGAGGETQGQNGTGGATDGGVSDYEPIYAPSHIGGSGGTDVQVPEGGSGDPGDDVVGEGPTGEQNTGEVTVPYNEVYADYRDSAYSAVNEGDYPPEIRDIVRQYFSSLEP